MNNMIKLQFGRLRVSSGDMVQLLPMKRRHLDPRNQFRSAFQIQPTIGLNPISSQDMSPHYPNPDVLIGSLPRVMSKLFFFQFEKLKSSKTEFGDTSGD